MFSVQCLWLELGCKVRVRVGLGIWGLGKGDRVGYRVRG